MQNKFVGDVADFGKYGLIRYLSGETDEGTGDRLKPGIVWYLNRDMVHDAKHTNTPTNHGQNRKYLEDVGDHSGHDFRGSDPELWEAMHGLVSKQLFCVHCVQKIGIPSTDAAYFGNHVSYPEASTQAQRMTQREEWLSKAKNKMKKSGAGLILLDPDKGISPLKENYRAAGAEYVYGADIAAFWQLGSSLVIFHYHDFSKPVMDSKVAEIVRGNTEGGELLAVRYTPVQGLHFVIALQGGHTGAVKERIRRLTGGDDANGGFFKAVDI